ncbi:HAD family hydrolase [Amycolatopsis suaedae]|uniref:HAD family hydrolase n=1 Tax=Amycolatopsis suaedae TaxID=2510978 RepID=A0A4Q7JC20_9PSEU|nr:HAD family hydrolase [Amycolatopsis suaedae]RZQ64063.1 HAD family hydrolase [Amycolatopsis suaedae]
MRRDAQVLIFDADDTLWENNILFERVIDDFLDWMADPTLGRAGVRAILDDIERANAVTHGYGSVMFLRSLRDCVERLRNRPANAEEIARLDQLAAALITDRPELIPGVAETLAELAARHRLLVLTKGAVDEQRRKLAASGLEVHFGGVHIVAEKHVEVYRDLAASLDLPLASTWMIGNSPKSDILPARAAGLGAVFIPNANTWVLESDELDAGDTGVLTLAKFPELLEHF